MHIMPFQDIQAKPVTTPGARDATIRVVMGPEHGAPHFTTRVFEIAPGGESPRHRHASEHEVFFLAGTGEVFYDGAVVPVAADHIAFIPSEVEHQIRNTGGEVLRFLCIIPNNP